MKKISKQQRSPCPIAGALDLVGDRWTLLIIRDMLHNKQRFDDFLKSPEGIATNILSQRLRSLVDTGLAQRKPDPLDGRKVIYTLTQRGASLEPLVHTIAEWGLDTIDEVYIGSDYQAQPTATKTNKETPPTLAQDDLHKEHFDFDRIDLL